MATSGRGIPAGGIDPVRVTVTRSKLICWNPAVVEEAGLEGPPASWDEFLTQAEALEAAGKTPLTIGPLWTQEHLLENVLLGELGPDTYAGLWNGETDWESQEVVAALDMFTQVLEHTTASGDRSLGGGVSRAAHPGEPSAGRSLCRLRAGERRLPRVLGASDRR